MLPHIPCHLLLLVFLSGRAVVLVKASNNAISCGYDVNCQAIVKLMATVDDVNQKLDKQAKGLEEQKEKLDGTLASTAAISTQLERLSADFLNHDGRLKAHDVSQTNIYQLVQSIHGDQPRSRDCSDIREGGSSVSGVYRVYLERDNKQIEVDVYCDFKNEGQSWLVFQRRKDGSVDFYRNWNDYANGFGDLTGEFWLGNEKLSLLTMNRKYQLRIEMEDFEGEKRWAEYATFSVKPSTDKYRLSLGAYSGNAGDSFTDSNNMMFSTKDADNDLEPYNCAHHYPAGWWCNRCFRCNLNGLYLRGSHSRKWNGVSWFDWKGVYYSLKVTEMKIAAVK